MTPANPLLLRLYLRARHAVPLLAKPLLKRRLRAGKEHPTRWVEKCGTPGKPRPTGPLIWLHAVGLGEVLSLRGLISTMSDIDPAAHFVITSTALSSATGIAGQLPARTTHQFLPLDAPRFTKRFLDHWRPDLVIWAEQDIWPGLICDIHARAIPQALINARMNAASLQKHLPARSLYSAALSRMALITAQDSDTAQNLKTLGTPQNISLNPSLKAAAPPLSHDPQALKTLQKATQKRRIWITAPAHAPDADMAIRAHKTLLAHDPTALLIIAPRNLALALPAHLPRRSAGQLPTGPIWIADTLGEMGTLYRLADTALIGGSFGDTQGHSPWEAACLGCAILHGPHTANFASDYATLARKHAAIKVADAQDIANALLGANRDALTQNATALITQARADLHPLALSLLALKAPA
uniref:3-deoxy-D-manno-octulosonic acid transferase n=1 Tax=Yoonia sp. TaxID=2212373 RepID=UPI00404852FB|tara:strand:- start:247 stop:1485 length:1239 start_codon:yes stop_codon:yes gene_type:complete